MRKSAEILPSGTDRKNRAIFDREGEATLARRRELAGEARTGAQLGTQVKARS